MDALRLLSAALRIQTLESLGKDGKTELVFQETSVPLSGSYMAKEPLLANFGYCSPFLSGKRGLFLSEES